jgi:hypothetical protein
MAASSQKEEWLELINKEAWGIDDSRLGNVRDIDLNYVIIERGVINKERFYIPKQGVLGYDNKKVIFRVTEEEARTLLRTEVVIRQPIKTEKFSGSRRISNRKKVAH